MNYSRKSSISHTIDKPIHSREWSNMTPDERTRVYFHHAGYAMVNQTRWWNSPMQALAWFEQEMVKN